MDNREKIYEHGGELGNVQDLFEITANHVHYRKWEEPKLVPPTH